MNIQLSEHFTYRKLLRFVLPSIVMMIFTSIYSVVDGLFVSNFVGKSAFAAINLMMPFLMGISALGFMIGTGGSALVAKTLGEGKKEKANEYFSMLVYITLAGGLIIAILSAFAMRPVAIILGARGELLKNCVLYGRILCISLTCFMLQNVFQSFFVAAEKPHLGLRVVVIAGVTNMLLDFLFVAVLHWGLAGAAIATVCGELIGGIFPIFYFGRKNSSLLKLGKTHFYPKVLLKTCTNGSSELMTNLSSSLVNSLYNLQLMKFAGEDGVAAYEKAKASIEESMKKLQTEYLDLLLIHQPFGDYYGTYRAMEELYQEGKLRAIGVSNFGPDRYLDIQHFANVKPAVNQIETHVFQQQKIAKEYLQKYGCQIESWGPFAEGRGDMFTNPVLTEIGAKYGKTAAQTALRFLLQSDVVIIPKSVHKERMQQNFDLFDFTLTPEDMTAIEALDGGESLFFSHYDPKTVEWFMSIL